MKFLIFASILCLTSCDVIIDTPEDLWDVFRTIGDAIDIFPGNHEYGAAMLIRNTRWSGLCITTEDLNPQSKTGKLVDIETCNTTGIAVHQEFRLSHDGNGGVAIVTTDGDCIGFGNQVDIDSSTYTGDWCQSPTHQFRLEMMDVGAIRFRHRSNEDNCMEILPGVFHQLCNDHDNQLFQVCSLDGQKCYPIPKTSKM